MAKKKEKIFPVSPGPMRFIVMQMPNTDYEKRFEDNEVVGERFATREEAQAFILDECRTMIQNERELRVGKLDNYLMRYAVYEMVSEHAFDVLVSYKIIPTVK